MRILVLSDWTANPGGAEHYATMLAPALRDAGHDARLVACGVAVPDDAGADRVFGTTNRAAQAVLQIANVPAVSRVRALVRTWRPDLAIVPQFAYHLSPAVFGALDGVDVVAIALDYKFICPLGTKLLPDGSTCRDPHGAVCWRRGCVSALHWLRDRPRYRAMAARLRPPTRIVACSHGVQAALAREGIESECVLLPVPPASPSYRRQPAAAPLFVYVGRLAAAKGVDVLVHAFAALAREVPAARLRVIGDGPERASLTHLAASAGVGHAVTFTGTLAPPDVEQELARAWALVAPSRWEEPFGLVAVEAIVRGVPVVASARGGFAETVEDGVSGRLVPNGDVGALTEAMRAIASRRVFPTHEVPDQIQQHLIARHDPRRHIERLLAPYGSRASQ